MASGLIFHLATTEEFAIWNLEIGLGKLWDRSQTITDNPRALELYSPKRG